MKDIVKILCYGIVREMKRCEAIDFYEEAISCCEGSERDRYFDILSQLYIGHYFCTDEAEELGEITFEKIVGNKYVFVERARENEYKLWTGNISPDDCEIGLCKHPLESVLYLKYKYKNSQSVISGSRKDILTEFKKWCAENVIDNSN